jgi:S-adenosylmethionine synthetase
MIVNVINSKIILQGFDFKTCSIIVSVAEQSPEIANSVHGMRQKAPEVCKSPSHRVFFYFEILFIYRLKKKEIGAGDQGHMFGYATDETPEFMPLTHVLSNRLIERLVVCRESGVLPWLRPDAKVIIIMKIVFEKELNVFFVQTQVTVEYKNDASGKVIPLRVHTVVISTQHAPTISHPELVEQLMTHVVKEVIPANLLDEKTVYHINPSGSFIVGGNSFLMDGFLTFVSDVCFCDTL